MGWQKLTWLPSIRQQKAEIVHYMTFLVKISLMYPFDDKIVCKNNPEYLQMHKFKRKKYQIDYTWQQTVKQIYLLSTIKYFLF